MAIFRVEVLEVLHRYSTYEVEAESANELDERTDNGEQIHEMGDLVDSYVSREPVQIESIRLA